MVQIAEIEVGPHFLTFYGSERKELLQFAREYESEFKKLRPELKDIQQKDLAHEPYDPRVYHPYGHPTPFPKGNRPIHDPSNHFHIRYGYRPTQADIEQVMEDMNRYAKRNIFVSDLRITNLEDQIGVEFSYPEIPDNHEDYLQMIEDIRNNKYDSKVE